MKQIKTIIVRRDYVEDFDRKVNLAISEGWTLVRRYIDPGLAAGPGSTWVFYPVLVAELERDA